MRTQPYLKSPLHITKPNIFLSPPAISYCEMNLDKNEDWISPSPHSFRLISNYRTELVLHDGYYFLLRQGFIK